MMDPTAVRVVVAIDDARSSEAVRRTLGDLGYVAAGSTTDSEKALELVRDVRPDVLVLDSRIVHSDATAVRKETAEFSPTPVVFLLPEGVSEIVLDIEEEGVASYLTQPVTSRGLDRAIAVALARSRDAQRLRALAQKLEETAREARAWKQRYAFATAAPSQVVYECDLTTRTMAWGDGVERVLGYVHSELEGGLAQWEELIDPHQREAALRSLAPPAGGGSSCQAEYRLRHQDGHFVWILDRRSYLAEPSNQPRLVAGVMQDITEQKQAEEFAGIERDLALGLGQDGDLRTALNRVLMATLSLEGIDCGGVYLADRTTGALELVCHSGLSDAFVEAVRRYEADSSNVVLVSQGAPIFADSEALSHIVHLPGGEGLRALAVLPVAHEGEILAVVSVASKRLGEIPTWLCRDLEALTAQIGGAVARLRAQAALKDSGECFAVLADEARAAEKRVLDIVDFLPDATFVIDRDKKVIAWNRALEEMTGTRKEDIVGKGDFAYAIPFYGQRRPIVIDLIGLDEPTLATEYDYVKRQGQTLYAEVFVPSLFGGRGAFIWVTASPLLDQQGNQIGAIESVRDVTARREAEESLRSAEEKYRSIFENALEGIFRTSPNGRIMSANPALARIAGCDSADGLIARVNDLGGQIYSDVDARRDILARIVREGVVEGLEVPLRRLDGTAIWVLLNARASRNDEGGVQHFDGFVIDITERKRAEDRVRESEERYRTLFEQSPIGIYRTTPDGRIIAANPSLVRMLGFRSFEELAARNLEEHGFEPTHSRSEFKGLIEREGEAKGLEAVWITKTGSPVLLRENARAIRDASGHVRYYEGTAEDITEQRRAEEDLKDSEERFRSTFEQAAVGVTLVDAEGRFLRINQRFCDIAGYTREELLKLTFQDITHPDDVDADVALTQEVWEGKRAAYSMEKRYLRGDGSVRWVELTVSLVRTAAGSPGYFIGVVQDINERKGAEEALRASEEKFRTVVEELSEGLALIDEDGAVIEWNKALEGITGIPRDKAVGLPYWDLQWKVMLAERRTPETYQSFKETAIEAAKSGNLPGFPKEIGIHSLDGRKRTVQQSVFRIKTATGYCIGTVTSDISERKRAHEELRRRAEFDALVTQLLARFASGAVSEVDEHVNASLREICRFVGAECGFVAMLSEDATAWTMTHEWSGPGIAPLRQRYQNQQLGTLPWIEAQLIAGRTVRFGSLDDLPPEASVERKLFVEGGVKSVLDLPLWGRGGASRGWIELRSHSARREWSVDDVRCVGVLADAIANGLDRKRAEETLRVSEERFRTIVQQAGDFITVHDASGRFIYESPATETVLGYGPGGLMGRDPLTLVHPEDLALVRQELERTYQGTNLGIPTEYRVRHADGHWVHVETIGRNLLDHPAVRGVVLTSRDITARKRTEQALVDGERRLRLVLDNTREILVLWAVKGPDRFQVVTVNHEWTEWLHRGGIAIAAESLVGKSFEEVFEGAVGLSPRIVAADKLHFMRAVETRSPVAYEMSVDAPAGTFFFEMTLCPVLDEVGRCTHVLRASRDITEKRRALEELRRSEESFSTAFRSSPAPMGISRTEDGMILDVNEALERMTGFGRDELIGRTTVGMGAWANPKERERIVETLATTGSIRDKEIEFRAKAGEAIIVRYSAVTVEAGGQKCLLSVFMNVTERRRAEDALRAEKAFTDALIESVPGTFFAFEEGSRLVRWNTEYERVIGWSASELPGRQPLAFIEERERPAVAEKIREVLETGSGSVETRIVTKDGRSIPYSFNAKGVEIGGHTYLVGVGLDISDRKRSEERQARLQEQVVAAAAEWTETFDAVATGLIVTGLDGAIRRMNVAARDLAGVDTWEDIIGCRLSALGEGEPWRTVARLVDQADREGSAVREQVRESESHHVWALEASRVGGAPGRVITVIRDITSLMELQESLARKETMSAMGTLVGGVAHEVRNPLFGISGLLDALDAKFGRDEKLGEYFEALRRETDRLTDLMRALLEFGRPINEERAATPLALVTGEAVVLCRRDAAIRNVDIIVNVPDTLPRVPMDRTRMVEVLRNLVENAIQHSPTGGKVVVAARLLETARPGWLEVTVKDSGPGFDEAFRTKVFEPFFSRRTGGTGLGLSIVQRVVTAHGGEVQAGNHLEGGGVVTVQLPI